MINNRFIYNNEAISSIAISMVLRHSKELSYAKTMLILPFLYHEEGLAYLKRTNSKVRSIEEFMSKSLFTFSNFNSRYLSLLPISINSILILQELELLRINEYTIEHINNPSIEYSNTKLGKRALEIEKASLNLSILLEEDSKSLYHKLRIQL